MKVLKHSAVKCKVCYSPKLTPCLTLLHASRDVSKWVRKNEFKRDLPINLRVYSCQYCGHVQLIDKLKSRHYDEYLLHNINESPALLKYIRSNMKKFVVKFKLRGKRVIDVGCGHGDAVKHLCNAGAHAAGIDPSAQPRSGLKNGLTLFRGYVNSRMPIPGAPYDAFVSRQVLEHIDDPNDFLKGIHLSVNPGAVGFIEVPNLGKAIKYKRFYDFFPDHVNYFSEGTLAFLLEQNRFHVLSIKTVMNGDWLTALVRVDPRTDFSSVQCNLDILSKNINEFTENAHRRRQRIAVWGAGAKGITTLAVTRVRYIEYVVDSDPAKHGFFTVCSHIPMVGPEHIRKHPVDIIIITAMSFCDEITRYLRCNLKYKRRIVNLYQLSSPTFTEGT